MPVAPRVIMCDRCNKPCDRVEEWTAWEGTSRETVKIRVWCHGETEAETLQLSEAIGIIAFGRAFKQAPALPAYVDHTLDSHPTFTVDYTERPAPLDEPIGPECFGGSDYYP